MAAVRGRRPGRKIPGWQMPRMFLSWIVLVSLALALGESSQMNVTYNMEKRTLRIACPLEENLLASYLKRQKNNSKIDLANRRYVENNIMKGTSQHERIQVQNSTGEERLIVELNHVTCFDSALYICKNNIGISTPSSRFYNYAFTYMGEATKPYLSAPVQKCYKPGDQLQLNCSASVGAKDNYIVWTVKRTGTTEASIPLKTSGRAEETVEPDCSLRRSSQLNYTLTHEDDGAIFECRLNSSGHSSRIIVALCCPDVVATIPAGTTSKMLPYSEAALELESKELHKQLESPKTAEVRDGNDRGAKAPESSSSVTVVIAVSALAALLAVCFVVMLLLMRRWKKRQMRPLVVVDTPAASEYGYDDGRLPHLLHSLSMLDRHTPYPAHDLSTRSTSTLPTSTTSRYVDSPLSSANYHHQEDPNVSVYVTMSGLDSLQRPTPEPKQLKNLGQGRDPEPRSMSDNPASMLSEYDNDMGPNMREERSESIYSNEGRNIRQGSRNNANVDAAEITCLKIVA